MSARQQQSRAAAHGFSLYSRLALVYPMSILPSPLVTDASFMQSVRETTFPAIPAAGVAHEMQAQAVRWVFKGADREGGDPGDPCPPPSFSLGAEVMART